MTILIGMEELRKIIGKNLAELRKRRDLTQSELAEKFNYTDRAISKWENGDTLPDIETLYKICEFFGVTLDYLTREENSAFIKKENPLQKWNKITITALVVSVIWTLATVIFVISLLNGVNPPYWQAFIWAIPASCVFVNVFNAAYFHNRWIYFISWSLFIWGVLIACYFSLLEYNIWPIFIIGVPAQATMIIWLNIRKIPKKSF